VQPLVVIDLHQKVLWPGAKKNSRPYPLTSQVSASRRHTWQGIATAKSHFWSKCGPLQVAENIERVRYPLKRRQLGFACGQEARASGRFGQVAVFLPMDLFVFQGFHERFAGRIVVGIALAALTTGEAAWHTF